MGLLQYIYIYAYTGWWFQPPETYKRQLGLLFPIYGKKKSCSKPPTIIYIYALSMADIAVGWVKTHFLGDLYHGSH